MVYKSLSIVLSVFLFCSCTKRSGSSGSVDDVSVESKSFEISGVKVGYDQFGSYLCFQLIGGLYMVKNQYYTQKLAKAEKEVDRERAQRLVQRTQSVRELMTRKSEEIAGMRRSSDVPFEEQAVKAVDIQVGAFDTLKHFEPEIAKLCLVEADKIRETCYKMKDQALFSKCYDEMGKELNKKVLKFFNSNYAT